MEKSKTTLCQSVGHCYDQESSFIDVQNTSTIFFSPASYSRNDRVTVLSYGEDGRNILTKGLSHENFYKLRDMSG
ncbi:hypothetical protein AB9K17_23580, partial [Salmonella enterica subsp. enterica serovar Kentucky]|uniref:hypothetical protein n=1 Tax=Salmonella enterica TaxID=28901 RepID=UPI003F4BB4EA